MGNRERMIIINESFFDDVEVNDVIQQSESDKVQEQCYFTVYFKVFSMKLFDESKICQRTKDYISNVCDSLYVDDYNIDVLYDSTAQAIHCMIDLYSPEFPLDFFELMNFIRMLEKLPDCNNILFVDNETGEKRKIWILFKNDWSGMPELFELLYGESCREIYNKWNAFGKSSELLLNRVCSSYHIRYFTNDLIETGNIVLNTNELTKLLSDDLLDMGMRIDFCTYCIDINDSYLTYIPHPDNFDELIVKEKALGRHTWQTLLKKNKIRIKKSDIRIINKTKTKEHTAYIMMYVGSVANNVVGIPNRFAIMVIQIEYNKNNKLKEIRSLLDKVFVGMPTDFIE